MNEPKTKAQLGPPPRGKKLSMGEMITPVAANNMSEKGLKDLSFKVDPDFHHKFKTTASSYRLSMKDLLEECFDAWENTKK